MNRYKMFGKIKIFVLFVFVLMLGLFIYKISNTLVTNSLLDMVKIDEETSSYISFNYVGNSKSVVEISNPKVVGDFIGKRLLGDNKFDFEISVSEEFVKDDVIEYELVAISIDNKIDNKYIKFYLTDQDNNALLGYKDMVPVFSVFSDTNDGKVIYNGVLSEDELEDELRLRIWISDKYDREVDNVLVYHLQVRIK